ncbi:MAG: agmatine deiminase [Gammaproteobacteria bacterium]|nr:agmatine deiminase [Gammaproteobacteria bacterium]
MTRPYLPPEWAPQDAVMLTWPHHHGDWAAHIDEVDALFARLACEIAQRETALIACHDDEHRAHVADLLMHSCADLNRVELYVAASNDSWARDHGPITVQRSGRPVLLDFNFNGWGGKYPAELDNRLTARLAEAGAFGDTPREPIDLVLEGGSIEVDGAGSLLTTVSCLLSPGRNPGLDRFELEQRLRRHLGVERILWLEHGVLEGDDTDGHIDTLARFCNEHTIAHVQCEDPADPHYVPLQAMQRELEALRRPDGKPYTLIPLPLPAPIRDDEGRRLPATYANFLILNQAVLVPVYGDPQDALACDRLAAAFPERELVALDCRPLIRQYGSLHCVTMQLPRGVLGGMKESA